MFCFLFVFEECLVRTYAVKCNNRKDRSRHCNSCSCWGRVMGELHLQRQSPECLGNIHDVSSHMILTCHKGNKCNTFCIWRWNVDRFLSPEYTQIYTHVSTYTNTHINRAKTACQGSLGQMMSKDSRLHADKY